MPTTVVLTTVTFSGKRVYVNFSDGTQLEYESKDALDEAIADLDNDVAYTQQMALKWMSERDPTLTSIAPIAGKGFTYDLSDADPVKVSSELLTET